MTKSLRWTPLVLAWWAGRESFTTRPRTAWPDCWLSLSIARRKRGEAVLEGAVTEAIEQLEDGLSKLRALVAIMRNAGFGGAPAVAGVVGILDGVIPEVRAGIARADVKLC